MANEPYFLIAKGPQAGTMLPLDYERLKEQRLILGRGGAKAKIAVDFILQDPGNRASAVHASLSWREDDSLLIVTDLGSANGTKVNERFIAGPTPLFPGDTLSCGTIDMLLMLPPLENERGYAQSILRKRGGLHWGLLEDGEPGIARLEVVENELRNPQDLPEPPRVGSFCRLTPNHPFTIGRFDTNDLQVLDLLVGRRHAEIRWLNNSYIISDMGTAHPAKVNEEPLVAPRSLSEGDEIRVGRLALRFRAPRRPYIPPAKPFATGTRAPLMGGALRYALTNRPLQVGAEYVRLPINRQILIGRDESNDLRLHDRSVSRGHVRLAVESGRFILTDIGSANGTQVNGFEIGGPTVLQNGDRIKIGDFEFTFEETTHEPGDNETTLPESKEEGNSSEASTRESLIAEVVKDPLLAGEPLMFELGKPIAESEAGDKPTNDWQSSGQLVAINHPLRAIPPFDELDTTNFNLLVNYFREVTFKVGQEMAHEGQGRGAFFAILEGTVTISRSLGQGKSRLVLGELGRGTVYGERTIFADQPFANRLEAKTTVRALILEEATFVRELMDNRTIVSFFQQQVSTNSAANWLKGTLLMQTLSDKTRRALAGRLRYRVYAAGETLAKKGEPCEEFFLIVGGAAQAYSVDSKGNEQSLTILEEGDNFGDGIAAQGETYPMTVRAERMVECYVLVRADFQNVLQKSGDPIASLGRGLSGLPLGAVLNRIPPFNTMPPQLVAQIGSRMKVKYFKKGEVIAWQGEQSSALYIVRSGQVQMTYRDSAGTERKDAKLGPGQFFGEASLLREQVHAAKVTALEDCELLTLFRNKLQEVIALGEGYALGQYFAQSLERRFRPKRVASYRIVEQTSNDGEKFYVLSDESGDNFFKLGDRGYFLWQQMDGDNTISDLALSYFMEYKVLDLEAVSNTVGQLQAAGFLQVPAVNKNLLGSEEQRKQGRLARYLTFRYEIKNIDGLIEKIYRYGGKFFFLKPVVWSLLTVLVLGLGAFIYFSLPGNSNDGLSFLLQPPVGIFKGSMWWLLIIIAFLNFMLHELAHALTCKSYGRRVSRGGFGWMYVGPYFYVNTDDIYLENRRARIAVDMVGPISNAVVGGICCLLMFLFNSPGQRETQAFLFQMATVAYIVAYTNVNPLMELDGYYALSNWLEIPSLRKKALTFMRRTILRQPQTRPVPPRERKIFFWFAVLTPVYLLVTMMQFLFWLAGILQELMITWIADKTLVGWLSWSSAGVVAVSSTLLLLMDLFNSGHTENEKKTERKKRGTK
ncbi:MAG: cyclic nucleotide-binding domain-containing protein [Chloroflexota bacterium]|nr:cyclic nucleotide-binding domain-containing protein [Chloroflexota bacterium]